MMHGLQGMLPGEVLVPAAGPDAAGSDVLVALNEDPTAIVAAVTEHVAWVHILAAGVDGIPLERMGGRTITCSRGASAPAIAEFVLASMLAFEKHLPEVWVTRPPAEWNVAPLGGLEGRTVGIIGLGAIGTEVARRAAAFDMQVLGVRRRAGAPVAGIEPCPDLPTLMARSDHVVVAAPATADTRHLVGEVALAAVKPGAHLVNVARGSLVDQEALLRALDDGRLALASLDVVEPEPLPEGHPLYGHPKVHLTPHVSWSSPHTIRRTFELFVDNLVRYRAGEPLLGRVDPATGY
jgi:phosphoglycerate dehydrogenase-like enzyme